MTRTLEDIEQLWLDYQPIREVDPMFEKVARNGLVALERKIQMAIKTEGRENPL